MGEDLADGVSRDFFQGLFSELKKYDSHTGTSALKLYLVAWCATWRMHAENESVCRFGCGGRAKDSMAHYVFCTGLRRISIEARTSTEEDLNGGALGLAPHRWSLRRLPFRLTT